VSDEVGEMATDIMAMATSTTNPLLIHY